MNSLNIASHLAVMAKRQPDVPAVWAPKRDFSGKLTYDQWTFGDLDAESERIARGLIRIGLGGARVALMVPPGLNFFSITFGMFKAGTIPVMIDPGIGLRNFGKCLEESKPDGFIGISKAHAARVLFGWGRRSIKQLVTVGAKWFWGGHSLRRIRELGHRTETTETKASSESAAILFTSGSTGAPKGVVYTHAMFAEQLEQVRQLYDIMPGEIDLPTFPLFALFGPGLGMTEVLPEMDFTRPAQADPEKLSAVIARFGVTNMFGSPALLNRLGRYGETHGIKLPTLRRVISAGAPVSAKVLGRFTGLLSEKAQVFTPYGATECLPVASIGSAEILRETRHLTDQGRGVCVGKPVAELDVRIIRISDEAIPHWDAALELPRGETGEIAVRGTQASRAYFDRPEATALAKISRSEGGFYHRMGDLGYFDELGRLWFCGRKSHRVVTPDGTFFTIPCEGIFNAHPAVFRSALVGVRRVGQVGQVVPVICIELEFESRGRALRTLTEELLALGARHPHTETIRTILYHPSFPVDIRHNAKIFREKLAVWAEKRCG